MVLVDKDIEKRPLKIFKHALAKWHYLTVDVVVGNAVGVAVEADVDVGVEAAEKGVFELQTKYFLRFNKKPTPKIKLDSLTHKNWLCFKTLFDAISFWRLTLPRSWRQRSRRWRCWGRRWGSRCRRCWLCGRCCQRSWRRCCRGWHRRGSWATNKKTLV